MRPMRTAAPEQGHPLTSMIDVVFLLLVFFICSMTFQVTEGRLDAELPRGGSASTASLADVLEPVEVFIEEDRGRPRGFRVRLWGHAVSHDQLAAKLAGALALDPLTPVRIATGQGVEHGHVVAVLDAALAAGATQVVFAG